MLHAKQANCLVRLHAGNVQERIPATRYVRTEFVESSVIIGMFDTLLGLVGNRVRKRSRLMKKAAGLSAAAW